MEKIVPFILIAIGLFSAVCSLKEYPFFMESRKAQRLIRVIGVKGTKIFYVTLGIALVVVGIVFLVHGVVRDAA